VDFTEARDSEWQWRQLGQMQVCNSLQTDNHASTPPLVFYGLDSLPASQPTALKAFTERSHFHCPKLSHVCENAVLFWLLVTRLNVGIWL